ncbi:MAG: hypothetical protein FWC57_03060 [Endomicrobia bacterium]|nr:hypothetical protein [Endomicrobiia bacterium]
MKKTIFIFALLFACSLGIISGCGGGGSSNNNSVVQNTVNGKQLMFTPASNYTNVSSDKEGLILKAGQTYTFEAYVIDTTLVNQVNKQIVGYDCSKTIWTVKGIGNFGTSGQTSAQGSDVTVVITAASGTTGSLKLELDGMILSFPVKIS